jgi:hypothetical protein
MYHIPPTNCPNIAFPRGAFVVDLTGLVFATRLAPKQMFFCLRITEWEVRFLENMGGSATLLWFVIVRDTPEFRNSGLGNQQDENGCILPAQPNVQYEAARLKYVIGPALVASVIMIPMREGERIWL